jgi:hypothetical protein
MRRALQPDVSLFNTGRHVTLGERQILHDLIFGFSGFIFFQLDTGLSFVHTIASQVNRPMHAFASYLYMVFTYLLLHINLFL